MSEADQPKPDLLQARFELCRRISAANALKLSRQREGFGAEITLLDRQRAGSSGGTLEQEAMWAEADSHLAATAAAVEALDVQIDALEADLAALDHAFARGERR